MSHISIDFGKWWTITALWFLYSFAVGGIAFVFACWFNKSRYMLAISTLILGGFFMINVFSQMNNFDFLKFFTLQSLFNTQAVLNGESVIWQMIILPIIAIPFYIVGVVKFLKKDLPL
jgi:ABC-2 type transport system permease protein